MQNEPLKAINKKVEIIYEDDYLIIVNKKNNLLVHPTKYENENTLANYIKYYFIKKNIFFDEKDLRWGICHRLDKETSGLIIVAKNLNVQKKIKKLFQNKKITKKYYALIEGKLKNKKILIETFLNRQKNTTRYFVSNNSENNKEKAITYFYEIKNYSSFSLIDCEIKTGQTHQIRVHAKFIGNPIINDELYNNKKYEFIDKMFLCAYYLKFKHPILKNKIIKIKINMPKYFIDYIDKNK